ncbi:MAG: protease complex subunit PrcB family protein [Thalassolituus sp.]
MNRVTFKFIAPLVLASLVAACGAEFGPEDDGDGFGSSYRDESVDVSFATLHQSAYLESGLEHDRTFQVFTDQESYEDELINYTSDQAQTVDFKENQVVLFDMGSRSSTGFSISLMDVSEADDVVTLEINYVRPGGDCSVTTTDTNPWVMFRIESTNEVVLQESFSDLDC